MIKNTILAADVKPLNSSGQALPIQRSQRSAIVPVIVPAGQTIPVAAAGTTFYVLQSNLAPNIRVSGGSFNSYYPGTGEEYAIDQPFAGLEIQNPFASTLTVLLFVGFSSFIDKRLFLTNSNFPQVIVATNPVANATTNINITDKSGQQITDINGNKWWAVNRVAVLVSNMDTGTTYTLQQKNGSGGSTPAAIAVFPMNNLNLPITGDYSMNVGGGSINAIVSEIYNVFPIV